MIDFPIQILKLVNSLPFDIPGASKTYNGRALHTPQSSVITQDKYLSFRLARHKYSF